MPADLTTQGHEVLVFIYLECCNLVLSLPAEIGQTLVAVIIRVIQRDGKPPDGLVDISLILSIRHQRPDLLGDLGAVQNRTQVECLIFAACSAPIEFVLDHGGGIRNAGGG